MPPSPGPSPVGGVGRSAAGSDRRPPPGRAPRQSSITACAKSPSRRPGSSVSARTSSSSASVIGRASETQMASRPILDRDQEEGVVRPERVDPRRLVGELGDGQLLGRVDEEDEQLDAVVLEQGVERSLDLVGRAEDARLVGDRPLQARGSSRRPPGQREGEREDEGQRAWIGERSGRLLRLSGRDPSYVATLRRAGAGRPVAIGPMAGRVPRCLLPAPRGPPSDWSEPRRPAPVDRQARARNGAPAAGLRRPEDEDPIDLRRPARLAPPEPRHLSVGVDVVVGDPRQDVALRSGR